MYSKAFRTLMVQKMTSPDRPDVESLAAEVGVPRSTIYRWASDAGKLTQRNAFEGLREEHQLAHRERCRPATLSALP